MMGRRLGRWALAVCVLALGFAFLAAPAQAQTGQVKGKVVDAKNQPVEGAMVTIIQLDSVNRKFELKTKKDGSYMQIGIPPASYKITAEKDGLAQTFETKIGIEMKEVNFQLRPGGITKEELEKQKAKVEGLKTRFAEGATLSNEGKYDEAIAIFNEVLTEVPKCVECLVNLGSVYSQKKEYDKAEEYFKKAIDMAPETVDAYNGLATVYNSQKKFKEAQEMSAEAAKRSAAASPGGAVNPEGLYNQGVIAWNASDFQKAQEHFAAAVAVKPDHAESHFMLAKVYLNLGKLADAAGEFQAYVKIAPTGPNAKEAQTFADQLKAYIK